MKAESENDVGNAEIANNPQSLVGDVIGDTAYSERFVLKLLLKVANRDTLLQAVEEPSFEQELCTLWDMTAERDVVLYLLKHQALNLFTFALPVIDSPRIIEVIIGTIANMCCHEEAVNSLITKENLMQYLMDLLKSDDSQILIQVLRLINSSIYECGEIELLFWLEWFKKVKYSDTLYFILKNSTNKELIMVSLENLNTLCSQCESVATRPLFSEIFVTTEANDVVRTAHNEYCKHANDDEKLERLHIITLQMLSYLTKCGEFNEVETNDEANVESAINLLQDILVSYETKIIKDSNINAEFDDVLMALVSFTTYLDIGCLCGPDKYFTPCFNMWKALTPKEGEKSCEELVREDLMARIKTTLGFVMCPYMCQCSDENFNKVLYDIGEEYGNIIKTDVEYGPQIARRAEHFKIRLNKIISS